MKASALDRPNSVGVTAKSLYSPFGCPAPLPNFGFLRLNSQEVTNNGSFEKDIS
jgi:hypothetical protein